MNGLEVTTWDEYRAMRLAAVDVSLRVCREMKARVDRLLVDGEHLREALEHARMAVRRGPRVPEREAREEVDACERAYLDVMAEALDAQRTLIHWLDLAEQYAREFAALPPTQPDA